MPPRDVDARKGEIMKAGRLFFDAVCGKPGDFERSVRDELDAEDRRARTARSAATGASAAPSASAATIASGAAELPPSLIRCDECGREQPIPATYGTRDVERLGWRRVGRAWRCSFCTD
jgi:hypothetical protein